MGTHPVSQGTAVRWWIVALLAGAALLSGAGPLIAATVPDDPPLAKEDHTRIVYVILANAAQVRQKVAVQQPTGADVLQAALKADGVDTYTRARIERVLRVLPEVEQSRGKISAPEAAALDEIAGRLAACTTLTRQIELLTVIEAQTEPDNQYARFSGVKSGLTTAERLVDDGFSTIYWVDWVYTALGDSPTNLMIHDGGMTEIGGGAPGDLAPIWTLTKDILAQSITGAMRGAAAYYAGHSRGATAAEYATAQAIADSVRTVIVHVD